MKLKRNIGWVDYCRVDKSGKIHCVDADKVPAERKTDRLFPLKGDDESRADRTVKGGSGWYPGAGPLFTSTSKVHAPSWGLPAGLTCPSVRFPVTRWLSTLKPGAPELKDPKKMTQALLGKVQRKCLACYAMGGNFTNIQTTNAQIARLQWFNGTPDKEVEDTLVDAIKHAGEEVCRRGDRGSRKEGCTFTPGVQPRRFRLFDSGDFNAPRDVRIWANVARRLPGTKFWWPTTVQAANCDNDPRLEQEKEAILAELRKAQRELPNITVRPSAENIDVAAARVKGFGAGTAVAEADTIKKTRIGKREAITLCDIDGKNCRKHFVCPGNCANCSMCWSKTLPVVYERHGLTDKAENLMTVVNRAAGTHKPLAPASEKISKQWDQANERARVLAEDMYLKLVPGPMPMTHYSTPEQVAEAKETTRKALADRDKRRQAKLRAKLLEAQG